MKKAPSQVRGTRKNMLIEMSSGLRNRIGRFSSVEKAHFEKDPAQFQAAVEAGRAALDKGETKKVYAYYTKAMLHANSPEETVQALRLGVNYFKDTDRPDFAVADLITIFELEPTQALEDEIKERLYGLNYPNFKEYGKRFIAILKKLDSKTAIVISEEEFHARRRERMAKQESKAAIQAYVEGPGTIEPNTNIA